MRLRAHLRYTLTCIKYIILLFLIICCVEICRGGYRGVDEFPLREKRWDISSISGVVSVE